MRECLHGHTRRSVLCIGCYFKFKRKQKTLAIDIGLHFRVISVTGAHKEHGGRMKAACCSFKAEVHFRKQAEAHKDDRNKGMIWKQWIVLLPFQRLTTTMCVVRSPRPRLAFPKFNAVWAAYRYRECAVPKDQTTYQFNFHNAPQKRILKGS